MAHAPGGPARPNKGPSKGPPERHHLSQGPGRKEKVVIAVIEERYRVIQVKRPITKLYSWVEGGGMVLPYPVFAPIFRCEVAPV